MSSSRTSTLPASPSFGELGVSAPLVAALDRAGVTQPFAVQTATLPDAIAGRDVLVRAQTGSGKTLAFGLAAITRLEGVPAVPMEPLALILVPTRELAMQVNDGLSPLVDAVGLRIRLVAGGMPYRKQVDAIRRGVHIVVATPGRLMDLVSQGAVDLSRVRITVLDEADQMADMGFLPQVREILDLTAPGDGIRQGGGLDGEGLSHAGTVERGDEGSGHAQLAERRRRGQGGRTRRRHGRTAS